MNLHSTIMKHLYWLLLSALTVTCSAQTQIQAEQIHHGRIFTSKASAGVESRQEIKVICKGKKTREREGRQDKGHEEFQVITTYIISYWLIQSKNLHEWVIQIDNNGFLQSEYFSDQSHEIKPFTKSSVVVNENQIVYTLNSSHKSGANVSYASK